MDTRLNKPRVFLSHSKADSSFIERLQKDLRGCQVEPWLDTDEIRHGKPWLDAIFEEGIPTCDAVLVYFTESSLESAMVKREMDAAILQQLKDRRVAFLPYASSETVRGLLRADIQALQTPVWDEDNYVTLLPRVVAEIWRSYLERTVTLAAQDEKVRRLEAELALESLRRESSDSVFSGAEEAEFTHIWTALDRPMAVKVEVQEFNEKRWRAVRLYSVSVVLNTLLPHLIQDRYEYDYRTVPSALEAPLSSLLSVPADAKEIRLSVHAAYALTDELTMYGLLERIAMAAPTSESKFVRPSPLWGGPQYSTVWSSKSQRLRYWLSYHGRLSAIEFGDDVRETLPPEDDTTA